MCVTFQKYFVIGTHMKKKISYKELKYFAYRYMHTFVHAYINLLHPFPCTRIWNWAFCKAEVKIFCTGLSPKCNIVEHGCCCGLPEKGQYFIFHLAVYV